MAEWLYYDNHVSPAPDEAQNLTHGLGWSWRPAASEGDMYSFHLNRVLGDLPVSLQDREVLDIGCGAGREAEHLCRVHLAYVTGVDIAPGSVRAAQRRSVNFGYSERFDAVAGDMECLPFNDNSFDLALTTTALHHAPHWSIAVREMIRVARESVLIDEAADAAVTRLAVWLRASSDVEHDQSGNTVTRFTQGMLGSAFAECGAWSWQSRRYWLNTSKPFRRLTLAGLQFRPILRILESEASLRIQSVLLNRVGNRLTVFAKL